MRYPGNAALSADVQQRIADSFQQTLTLVAQGNEHEGKVGCEFILGMDPLFQPANTLLQRIASEQRPVVVDDLREPSAGGSPPPPATTEDDDIMVVDDPIVIDDPGSADDIADLDALDLDGLQEEPVDASPMVPPAPARSTAPAGGGLGAVLEDLIAQRNFEQVLQIAQSQQATIEADPALQALVQQARSSLESSHYVDQFLEAAEQARTAGNTAAADKLIAKARVLDPEHPGLQALGSSGPTAPAANTLDTQRIPAVEDEPVEDEPVEDEPVAVPEPTVEPIPVVEPEPASVDLDPSSAAMPALDDPLASLDDDVAPTVATAFPSASDPPDADRADATEDDGDRVAGLLAEGQQSYDGGDYQGAIDIWSRIFLIDIDNEEASNRIDKARGRKAERERQAEEVFHEGLEKLESQQLDEARAAFARVLELQPSHSVAREYLEQLDAGEVPAVAPSSDRASSTLETTGLADEFEETTDGSPSLEEAVRRDRVVAVKRTDRRLLMLGAAVLILVIATLGFLFSRWDDLFPNADDQQRAGGRTMPTQIGRATALHEKGSTEAAIRILESVAPNNPLHDQAQALVTQWRALIETPVEAPPSGPSDEQLAARASLIEAARQADAQDRWVMASRHLAKANEIVPLADSEIEFQRRLTLAMEPIQTELNFFEQGEWTQAIPRLWRRLDDEPGEPNAKLLLGEAYYNLALRALQRGDAKAAAESLTEAISVEPDDEQLKHLLAFAQTYERRPQDLLYRIFVKYLPARP